MRGVEAFCGRCAFQVHVMNSFLVETCLLGITVLKYSLMVPSVVLCNAIVYGFANGNEIHLSITIILQQLNFA